MRRGAPKHGLLDATKPFCVDDETGEVVGIALPDGTHAEDEDLHADARRGPLREEDRALGRLLLKWPSRSGVWVSDSGLHTVPHHDWADGLLLQVHGAADVAAE